MLLSESRVIFINQAASSFNRNVIATLSEIPLKGHGVRLEKGKKRREGCIKFILCPLIMFSEEKLKVCLIVSVTKANIFEAV